MNEIKASAPFTQSNHAELNRTITFQGQSYVERAMGSDLGLWGSLTISGENLGDANPFHSYSDY